MRTDVKSLIVALTAERDSLSKAIQVLAELDRGASPAEAVRNVKAYTRRTRPYAVLSHEAKRAIVRQMAQSTDKSRLAHALAQEHGCAWQTIYASWGVWARKLGPVTAPVVISQALYAHPDDVEVLA